MPGARAAAIHRGGGRIVVGRIRVLIAGNIYVKRALVSRFLEDDGYEVVGEATTGEELLPAIRWAGPTRSWWTTSSCPRETLGRIRREAPDAKVVVFTSATPGEGGSPRCRRLSRERGRPRRPHGDPRSAVLRARLAARTGVGRGGCRSWGRRGRLDLGHRHRVEGRHGPELGADDEGDVAREARRRSWCGGAAHDARRRGDPRRLGDDRDDHHHRDRHGDEPGRQDRSVRRRHRDRPAGTDGPRRRVRGRWTR